MLVPWMVLELLERGMDQVMAFLWLETELVFVKDPLLDPVLLERGWVLGMVPVLDLLLVPEMVALMALLLVPLLLGLELG